jgi:hypothetical protein
LISVEYHFKSIQKLADKAGWIKQAEIRHLKLLSSEMGITGEPVVPIVSQLLQPSHKTGKAFRSAYSLNQKKTKA